MVRHETPLFVPSFCARWSMNSLMVVRCLYCADKSLLVCMNDVLDYVRGGCTFSLKAEFKELLRGFDVVERFFDKETLPADVKPVHLVPYTSDEGRRHVMYFLESGSVRGMLNACCVTSDMCAGDALAVLLSDLDRKDLSRLFPAVPVLEMAIDNLPLHGRLNPDNTPENIVFGSKLYDSAFVANQRTLYGSGGVPVAAAPAGALGLLPASWRPVGTRIPADTVARAVARAAPIVMAPGAPAVPSAGVSFLAGAAAASVAGSGAAAVPVAPVGQAAPVAAVAAVAPVAPVAPGAAGAGAGAPAAARVRSAAGAGAPAAACGRSAAGVVAASAKPAAAGSGGRPAGTSPMLRAGSVAAARAGSVRGLFCIPSVDFLTTGKNDVCEELVGLLGWTRGVCERSLLATSDKFGPDIAAGMKKVVQIMGQREAYWKSVSQCAAALRSPGAGGAASAVRSVSSAAAPSAPSAPAPVPRPGALASVPVFTGRERAVGAKAARPESDASPERVVRSCSGLELLANACAKETVPRVCDPTGVIPSSDVVIAAVEARVAATEKVAVAMAATATAAAAATEAEDARQKLAQATADAENAKLKLAEASRAAGVDVDDEPWDATDIVVMLDPEDS